MGNNGYSWRKSRSAGITGSCHLWAQLPVVPNGWLTVALPRSHMDVSLTSVPSSACHCWKRIWLLLSSLLTFTWAPLINRAYTEILLRRNLGNVVARLLATVKELERIGMMSVTLPESCCGDIRPGWFKNEALLLLGAQPESYTTY